MTDDFGRPGRRADLARQLHEALLARGLAPVPGGARSIIDRKIADVARAMRMSETSALEHFGEREILQLATGTADEWNAAQLAAGAAGDIPVAIPARSAAQLVAGLAMAVGQIIREAYGDLSAAAGRPLDVLCELGVALAECLEGDDRTAEVTLDVLSATRESLLRAAEGVADGSVPVVVADSARPQFAARLRAHADLAQALQP